MMPPILSGLRVVELAHMVAAPVCGQILASLGAEVTKIEPPDGDITRHLGPQWEGTSALFAATNPGKRSVRADVRDPAAGARCRSRRTSSSATSIAPRCCPRALMLRVFALKNPS